LNTEHWLWHVARY